MINREIGFPDQYFYLYTSDEELRKRKEFDGTKKEETLKNIYIYLKHFSVIMKISIPSQTGTVN